MFGISQFQTQRLDQKQVSEQGCTLHLMVRSVVRVAVVIAATGLIPLAAQAAASTPAPKPVIQAKLSGSPLPGVPGSYCWPQPGQSPCALIEDPQPKSFVPANPGDVITFSLNPAGDPIASMVAIFLDDAQADGKPRQLDLTAAQNAYTVDTTLSSGPHRIEVDAAYPALADGSQNFVAYVFGIQVNNPTAAVKTQAVGSMITAVAAVPTGSAGSGTAAATLGANVTTAISTQLATVTSTPTNTLTVTPSPSATDTATNTLTNTPTDTLTNTPSPTATDTATATPTFTPTVTPSITPTSTGIALGNGLNVPKLALIVGTRSYEPVAVTASMQDESGAFITVTRPNNASSPFVRATGGTTAQLQFSGPKPVSELASLQTGDATTLISQQVIPPDTVTLYTLPAKAGLYTLSIAVQWAQGSASYIFHVQISG